MNDIKVLESFFGFFIWRGRGVGGGEGVGSFPFSGIITVYLYKPYKPGLILGLHPANERRRYKVTPSLIGWVQT